MENSQFKHLVIGHQGQVGSAIFEILSEKFLTIGIDKGGYTDQEKFQFIHICIPYVDNKTFTNQVKKYQEQYLEPNGLVIIHSSVPVGTTAILGEEFVHSPIRGVHPNLREGIKTFVKFFGGIQSRRAAAPFVECGINCVTTSISANTEALKLWDTLQYGLMIGVQKKMKEFCDRNDLDFDLVYTEANKTYNEGYSKLGMGHVQRPVLHYIPGKIGGHCVIPNAHLLSDELSNLLLEWNKDF